MFGLITKEELLKELLSISRRFCGVWDILSKSVNRELKLETRVSLLEYEIEELKKHKEKS